MEPLEVTPLSFELANNTDGKPFKAEVRLSDKNVDYKKGITGSVVVGVEWANVVQCEPLRGSVRVSCSEGRHQPGQYPHLQE